MHIPPKTIKPHVTDTGKGVKILSKYQSQNASFGKKDD